MKKFTKLGLVSFSIFVLNAYSQTVVKADENGDTDTPVALASSTDQTNSSSSSISSINTPQNGNSTVAGNVNPTTEEATSTSNSTNTSKDGNIIDEGGYVNVEGQPAHFSEDGKSVVYNYTVAFKGMHSSDRGQTVRDIRIPEIAGSKVDFTLIGTRDANENPVDVNVPMKEMSFDEYLSGTSDDVIIPTAEELAAGKKPSIVNMNDSYEHVSYEYSNGKASTYAVSSKTLRSTALRVSVTVPLEEAKKIKYLPIDARFAWKCSQ